LELNESLRQALGIRDAAFPSQPFFDEILMGALWPSTTPDMAEIYPMAEDWGKIYLHFRSEPRRVA
jgi:hypothetical protein